MKNGLAPPGSIACKKRFWALLTFPGRAPMWPKQQANCRLSILQDFLLHLGLKSAKMKPRGYGLLGRHAQPPAPAQAKWSAQEICHLGGQRAAQLGRARLRLEGLTY